MNRMIVEIPRTDNPFPRTGISRDENGAPRFDDLPPTLLDVLRSHVESRPAKGVPTTHEAFLTNAENMIRCLGVRRDVGEELRTLICVPLFHVTGCNSQLLTALYVGGTSVIMPALDLPKLAGLLSVERITFLVSVPAVYSLLLRNQAFPGADVSSVRWLAYGGAPIA